MDSELLAESAVELVASLAEDVFEGIMGTEICIDILTGIRLIYRHCAQEFKLTLLFHSGQLPVQSQHRRGLYLDVCLAAALLSGQIHYAQSPD